MKLYSLLLLGTISAIQIQELVQQKHKEEPEQDQSEDLKIFDFNQKQSDSSNDLLEEFKATMAAGRKQEDALTKNLIMQKIQGAAAQKLESTVAEKQVSFIKQVDETKTKTEETTKSGITAETTSDEQSQDDSQVIAKAEQKFANETPGKNMDFVIGHKSQVHLANNKTKAWQGLTDKQKNYAYYMSEAEMAGSKSVLHDLSYEAPPLFLLLSSFFQDKNLDQLTKDIVKTKKVDVTKFLHFVLYSAGFFENFSSYSNFGHKKFIPELEPQDFEAIFKANSLWEDQTEKGALYRKAFNEIYPLIKTEIFAYDKPYAAIGFPEEGGVTGYFSRNINKEDLKVIKEFLEEQKIDILNTRAFKEGEKFIVTVASIETKNSKKNIDFKGKKFDIEYGEFSEYLKETVASLQKAKDYAKNDLEKEMIENYIKTFTTGNIEDHKNSQRNWIKDKIPEVESNMGWTEKYTDPENQRAIWEGFVAIVNKKRTINFTKLVNKGPQILKFMPWESNIEKKKFLAPDFTSLDMMEWHGAGQPSGINIPNYADIKDNEGFKNLVIEDNEKKQDPRRFKELIPHIKSLEDAFAINTVEQLSGRLQTAGHEMFGHGSGRLLYRDAEGKCPSQLIDPITQETIDSCYSKGESFQDKWGEMSSSYEECKADTAGLYLLKFKEMYEDFNLTQNNKNATWKDLLMSQMLEDATGGLDTLYGSYNAEAKKWKQAHSQARYVILQFILQNQKSKIVEIELEKGKDGKVTDYFVNIDKEKMATEGWELLKQLLQTLQIYKSTASVERAQAFYDKYSKVTPDHLEIRAMSEAQEQKGGGSSMRMYSQIVKNSNRTPGLQEYPNKFRGLIYTAIDKFQFNQKLYDQVMGEWKKHSAGLRVQPNESKKFTQLVQGEEQASPIYIQADDDSELKEMMAVLAQEEEE